MSVAKYLLHSSTLGALFIFISSVVFIVLHTGTYGPVSHVVCVKSFFNEPNCSEVGQVSDYYVLLPQCVNVKGLEFKKRIFYEIDFKAFRVKHLYCRSVLCISSFLYKQNHFSPAWKCDDPAKADVPLVEASSKSHFPPAQAPFLHHQQAYS